MRDKRGELTSKQLITIIILIISFVIILAFFLMLSLKSTIDKESCRNSVVMRGALPFGKDSISLKCKTQDVCLSMGGDCFAKEDMITVEVNNKNELIEEMVGLLWDCWWMMGQGEVDYASGVGLDESFCSICHRVYFDEEIVKNYEDGISYKKLYDFMEANKIPDTDETYMRSLYNMNSLDAVRDSLLEQDNPVDIYEYKINPSKEYVSVTAIVLSTSTWEIVGTAVGAVAGGVLGFIAPGAHWITIPTGVAVGGSLGMWVGPENVKYMVPRYLEFKGVELEALNCKEYVSEI